MDVRLDIKLKEKIKLKRNYNNHEIILLYGVIDSLEKSISGQVLKVIEVNGSLCKIMEKRATRSYRVYFVLIIYSEFTIVMDIVKKKSQQKYIDYLVKNMIEIYSRSNKYS